MPQIDSIGTYQLEVVEAGVNTTQTGKPQLVLRAKALTKYVDDADTMKHFGITEPGYVDWSAYNEDTVGFLLLFNSDKEFTDETKMLNYEQAQKAFGWAGDDFDTIAKPGQKFLGRFAEETYKDKTQVKLTWIDAFDADPVRSLKVLEPEKVSALSKLLKAGIGKKAPVAAAKPIAAAVIPKPASAAPKSEAPAQAGPVTSAGAPATTPTTASKSPSKAPPARTPPPKVVEESSVADLPEEISQNDAWDYLITHKGDNEDKVVEETWLAARAEVKPDVPDEKLTNADWAKIRNIVIKDLAL